jgi:hypothetical protein
MKVKEVPQDGKSALKTTLVHYAVNDEGAFEKIQSSGWDPGYYAFLNIHEKYMELAERAKERIKNNQTSPLEYFMYRSVQDIDDLAQSMGISKRKVKKHLTPPGFEKLGDDILERYALALFTDIETIKKFKSTL